MKTGWICLVISAFICFLFSESDSSAPVVICAILLLPLVLATLSVAVWGLCFVFWFIWHPYF